MSEIDEDAMNRSIEAIVHDLLKLPGQAGLDEKQKFSLTMEMLTLVAAEVVFNQSEGHTGDQVLLDALSRRAAKHVKSMRSEYERPDIAKVLDMVVETLSRKGITKKVLCPHCGATADFVLGEDHQPGIDATLCFACGGVGIVDFDIEGGARKATSAEDKQINADPSIQLARKAWAMAKE